MITTERKICRRCGRPFNGKPNDTLCSICSRNVSIVIQPINNNQNKTDATREKVRREMAQRYGDLKNKTYHPCARCGAKILIGMYCPDCLNVMRNNAKLLGERMEYKKRAAEELQAEIRADNIILVVDCDEDDLDLTKHILERNFPDYKISSASTQFKTMNILHGLKVRVMLLDDAVSKNYDGFKILRDVRADSVCKNSKVIMTSGEVKKENFTRGILLGVMDYISKPFAARELTKRVNEVLDADASTLLKRNKSKVLLIDGDQLELEIEKAALVSNFSCEVLTASNGIEGMWTLDVNEINLILVCMDMQFMDGAKFLDYIGKDKDLRIPVIIMTNSKDDERLRNIPKKMVRGYVSKPNFSDDDLILIKNALNESRGII